ncbi:MAG: peptidase S41, partial [Bacteroidaceae bacterium]|nr:peptidase S41 [Bacteroidaceae bacterium]
MKKLLLIAVSLSLFISTSCVREDHYDNSRQGPFEALWKIMDEHYCFFDYKKQEIGVDWDEVHTRYAAQVNENMSSVQLFEVLSNMLGELQDGHVNISAGFDLGRNWSFFEDYPENYNDSIARLYLGHNYQMASGLEYIILDDNIGYVRCQTFEEGVGDGNVSVMLNYLATCRGIIIDVRNNGGGQL